MEAALSEHSDISPVVIKEVILSACSLLYSDRFSSWQDRNKGHCLWEQAEKKSKLNPVAENSYSDSRLCKLQGNLDRLNRAGCCPLSPHPWSASVPGGPHTAWLLRGGVPAPH